MKIVTSCSDKADTIQAFDEAAGKLGNIPDGGFSLVIAGYSALHDSAALAAKAKEYFGDVPFLANTSCMGVMTEKGFCSRDGYGLGLFAIDDAPGAYGVGAVPMGGDAGKAAAEAVEKALENAGRAGEMPALIWLATAPGQEEAVLEGIEAVLGGNVPVLGGSSGDNEVAGEWRQIVGGDVFDDAVAVVAMFPSVKVSHAFHSGYVPTQNVGTITRAEGRVLKEIDGRPAAEVYDAWTGGVVTDFLGNGGNVLALTTLYPLGRMAAEIDGVVCYNLSHPDSVTPDGALTLFSEVREGEQITLMSGSVDSLTSRAGRVAVDALSSSNMPADQISGALAIYCAGCMLTVRSEMDKVVTSINEALLGHPFLGAFTFGEQGCFLAGQNQHGNLMISFVVFGK